MKVLHLLASPVFSGPAENVLRVASAQRALGVDVRVAVDRRRTVVSSEELALPRWQAAGLLDDGGLELSVKSPPWRIARDVVRLRRAPVDVLHTHFSHDHWLARWARRPGVVLVRSVHAARSLRATLPEADAFTVPVPSWRSRLPAKPVRVLPALVDEAFRPAEDRAALRHALGLDGGPVVGMVSTFQPSRRHSLALDAFALLLKRHSKARLVLVGDGGLEPELRRRVRSLGLQERVTFAGYQRQPQFLLWLQTLDEVWVLGLGNDFSGRAAAQARACGARVVAVDDGALSEWADALLPVDPTVEQLVDAALLETRVSRALADPREVARDLLALYEEASR